jgi:hypothetical protein
MANRIEPATIYSGADMLTTANPLYAQVSYSSKAILTRMQYECSGSRNFEKMMTSRTKNNEHPVTPPPIRNERMVCILGILPVHHTQMALRIGGAANVSSDLHFGSLVSSQVAAVSGTCSSAYLRTNGLVVHSTCNANF